MEICFFLFKSYYFYFLRICNSSWPEVNKRESKGIGHWNRGCNSPDVNFVGNQAFSFVWGAHVKVRDRTPFLLRELTFQGILSAVVRYKSRHRVFPTFGFQGDFSSPFFAHKSDSNTRKPRALQSAILSQIRVVSLRNGHLFCREKWFRKNHQFKKGDCV